MKYFSLTTGAISLLFGIYLFTSPLATVSTIGWILAVFIFIYGINGITTYFHHINNERNVWMLIQSTFSVIFGLLLITGSTFARSSIVIMILAYWMLVSGILRLITGYQLNRAGFPKSDSNHYFVSGILAIIFAIIFFSSPILSAAIIGRFVALIPIAIGISSIYTFIRL
ncbi:DUF308 domain-containing protein [Streptococcus sciuri]|uniref:DUF308 domain-containing protein n=1 Tax=Streptococcus sciuri TaxID=2973939 RepID=A0ABT2F8G8_9STRE|nr:DUF308 domain-containing protein [Streptococcus sciuri]MCS4488306.1 DUF308 domain-containing protein [Streptococcus sciuri]